MTRLGRMLGTGCREVSRVAFSSPPSREPLGQREANISETSNPSPSCALNLNLNLNLNLPPAGLFQGAGMGKGVFET